MLAIVEAAEQLADLFTSSLGAINQLTVEALKGHKSTAEAINEIEALTRFPQGSIGLQLATIQAERLRWKYTHRKNEKDKERKARARAGIPRAGAQPSTPSTLSQADLDAVARELAGIDRTSAKPKPPAPPVDEDEDNDIGPDVEIEE